MADLLGQFQSKINPSSTSKQRQHQICACRCWSGPEAPDRIQRLQREMKAFRLPCFQQGLHNVAGYAGHSAPFHELLPCSYDALHP